tara:strand:+ start:254 stop:1042 length:789 start_codon:yes stop_codon:yes gene_type:complete
MKKLILLLFIPLVFTCSDDGGTCVYQPTLSTEPATEINQSSVTLNGTIDVMSPNCDVPNNIEQGFVYSTEIQPTINDNQINVNGNIISITIENLVPGTTYYVRSFVTNNFGEFYGNEISFTIPYVYEVFMQTTGYTNNCNQSSNYFYYTYDFIFDDEEPVGSAAEGFDGWGWEHFHTNAINEQLSATIHLHNFDPNNASQDHSGTVLGAYISIRNVFTGEYVLNNFQLPTLKICPDVAIYKNIFNFYIEDNSYDIQTLEYDF